MNGITENKKQITLENDFVRLSLSTLDGSVTEVYSKTEKKSIKGKDEFFFSLESRDRKMKYTPKKVSLVKGVINVEFELGTVTVCPKAFDEYFTFEVTSDIPEYRFIFVNVDYKYDTQDKNVTSAVCVAMTLGLDPTYYPSGREMHTTCKCEKGLSNIGAEGALLIAPKKLHKELLKKIINTIDIKKGCRNTAGGPWGYDHQPNHGDYAIVEESSQEFLDKYIPVLKDADVDTVDFHQSNMSVRQGDFKFELYRDGKEFSEKVTKRLRENGMTAGLHTYAHYIRPDVEWILSDPKYQKQLQTNEEFTLKEDIDEKCDYIHTNESTECLPTEYAFFVNNLPYFLIGDEIVHYENAPDGFKKCVRGACGTKAKKHKKGEKIYHLEGHFYLFAPKLGSELFLEVARMTAKAYNEGDFDMIYLDALDGVDCHGFDTTWYYDAMFVYEIVRNCKRPPIIEFSAMYPSIWNARGRIGAWDTPYRNFRAFNEKHERDNSYYTDCHYTSTLGWYNFYPFTENQPGNMHTRYHYTDAIDHLGSIAVANDFTMVFNPLALEWVERFPMYRENIRKFKEYSKLRKSHYFSDEIRQKVKDDKFGHAIIKKGSKYYFVQKNFEEHKYYDFLDAKRNTAEFTNPFSSQVPTVRIEAGLSSGGNNAMTLLPLDIKKPLSEQKLKVDFGGEINLTDKYGFTTTVVGNGKKGTICIKLHGASAGEPGLTEYYIDTDFTGERKFILCECDNGRRPGIKFEEGIFFYAVYRSGFHFDRTIDISVETDGDVEGVRMSSVEVADHVYNVIKNPTVEIGKTKVFFECELKSTDYITFDGEKAVVGDRYGNEKPIYFEGELKAPKGKFKVKLSAAASLNNVPANGNIQMMLTGKIIK